MSFEIRYHESVIEEDLPRLSKTTKIRVKNAMEQKLTTYPEIFGKPLRKSLNGYRKLRVGDYRIIFKIENQFLKIFLIQHRSVVYKHAIKRIDIR